LSWNDFKIILRNVGSLLLIVSLLALVSIAVPLVFREYGAIYAMLVTSVLAGIAGLVLKFSRVL
jgi:hypothetical protein